MGNQQETNKIKHINNKQQQTTTNNNKQQQTTKYLTIKPPIKFKKFKFSSENSLSYIPPPSL